MVMQLKMRDHEDEGMIPPSHDFQIQLIFIPCYKKCGANIF